MTSTIMRVSVAPLFLELFTSVTMINISFCIANSNVACIDSERQALLKLKQDLNDPSNRLASWNIGDGDCCAWDGVVCNNFTGHVLQLNLGNPDPNHGTGSKLVGKINPSLVDIKHLIHLDLSGNDFQGIHIPKYLGSLQNLRYLNLSGAEFAGVIPHQLGNLSNLHYLDLSLVYLDMDENEFVGNIPTWMGERFSGLSILILRSNKFHGYLPIQLCRLTSLQILDVANNNLSGTIPRCISNFTAMATTDSSNLQNAISYVTMMDGTEAALDASVVTKGFMVEYDSILNLVRSIDISKNNFSGEIPMELTNLKGLQSLNLSHNFFTSKIPEKIGNMKSIESLDFSANQLSGEIPRSMSSLSFLSHLNLSNNHLTGKIPSSTQLQSFDAYSFAGNNLCGAPLPNCTEKNPLVPEDPNGNGNEDEDEDEVDWLLYVSLALGFVVGFWCFIGPLLVSRRWRYKYCHFLDGIMDEFGCFVRRCY